MINFARKLLQKELIRYLLMGGLNNLFGYGTFALFIWMGFHYAVAGVVSTAMQIVFSFKTLGVVVFKNKDNRLFLKFTIIFLLVLFTYLGGLKIFDLFGVNPYLSGFLLLVPISFQSYFLNKHFVFRKAKVSVSVND